MTCLRSREGTEIQGWIFQYGSLLTKSYFTSFNRTISNSHIHFCLLFVFQVWSEYLQDTDMLLYLTLSFYSKQYLGTLGFREEKCSVKYIMSTRKKYHYSLLNNEYN